MVRGRLLSRESVVAIDIRNADPSRWVAVSTKVVKSSSTAKKGEIVLSAAGGGRGGGGSGGGTERPPVRIAPGAAARITVPIAARGPLWDIWATTLTFHPFALIDPTLNFRSVS